MPQANLMAQIYASEMMVSAFLGLHMLRAPGSALRTHVCMLTGLLIICFDMLSYRLMTHLNIRYASEKKVN